MNKNRIAYLDVIRIIACMMVILMHSPMPGKGAPSIVLTGISFVTAPCIGLFFMVSGALLLPVSTTMKVFYRKRLPKVIIPTLVWTFIYILIGFLEGSIKQDQLLRISLSTPFSAQGNGILWFMYTLTGLYLISPVISAWLEKASKKEVEFVLCLWIVSLLYPMLSKYLSVNESSTGMLYYFSGYAGYYLLGYYVNRYQPKVGILSSLLMIVLPIIICWLALKHDPSIDFYKSFWYLSIFVAVMTYGWFSLIKMFRIQECSLLTIASSLSFGVYLCHILFMRRLIWNLYESDSTGWLSQILVTATVTFFLSFLFSFLVASTPLGKCVVGVRLVRTDR